MTYESVLQPLYQHMYKQIVKFSEQNMPEKNPEVYKRRLSCDYRMLI
jgi:hypothetical protein